MSQSKILSFLLLKVGQHFNIDWNGNAVVPNLINALKNFINII